MSEVERDDVGRDRIIEFCKVEGEMESIIVKKDTMIDDIVSKLCEGRLEYIEGSLKLYYDHPVEHFSVSIRKDDDLVHMCRVHELLNKRTCKIVATVDEAEKKKKRR